MPSRPSPDQIAALQRLIGAPYDPQDRRPGYHCWGAFRAAQEILGGPALPAIALETMTVAEQARTFARHPLRTAWVTVPAPIHGCAVLLSRRTLPIHIGCYLDLGSAAGVLHAAKPGVCFETFSTLEFAGWQCTEYLIPRR